MHARVTALVVSGEGEGGSVSRGVVHRECRAGSGASVELCVEDAVVTAARAAGSGRVCFSRRLCLRYGRRIITAAAAAAVPPRRRTSRSLAR